MEEKFSEYEQKFVERFMAVKARREAPKTWSEKQEYREEVLQPLESAVACAVNAFGDCEKIAKKLVTDAPQKAIRYANEYLWWLGHLGLTWDKRDNYAKEVASRLCSRGVIKEPKVSEFTGMGECYMGTHPSNRAKIAQICFLILQTTHPNTYFGEKYWWRVSWY